MRSVLQLLEWTSLRRLLRNGTPLCIICKTELCTGRYVSRLRQLIHLPGPPSQIRFKGNYHPTRDVIRPYLIEEHTKPRSTQTPAEVGCLF